MKVFAFIHAADPFPQPRLGALLPDGRTLVDLQAGHFSMTERPSPLLRDADAFASGGQAALEAARRVAAWVASQRPPGTTAPLDDVRVLRDVTPDAPGHRESI